MHASCICVGYCMIRFIVTVCMLQLVYADLAADSRRRVCLKNCVTWIWLWAPQPGMNQDNEHFEEVYKYRERWRDMYVYTCSYSAVTHSSNIWCRKWNMMCNHCYGLMYLSLHMLLESWNGIAPKYVNINGQSPHKGSHWQWMCSSDHH